MSAKVMKTLICDDEPVILEGLKLFLSDYDMDITSTLSGNQAIAVIPQGFDLIICDYKMTDGSGEDVLNFVLEKKEYFPEKFIFFSGNLELDQFNIPGVTIVCKPAFNEVMKLVEDAYNRRKKVD